MTEKRRGSRGVHETAGEIANFKAALRGVPTNFVSHPRTILTMSSMKSGMAATCCSARWGHERYSLVAVSPVMVTLLRLVVAL
jgi:hypothetical protein